MRSVFSSATRFILHGICSYPVYSLHCTEFHYHLMSVCRYDSSLPDQRELLSNNNLETNVNYLYSLVVGDCANFWWLQLPARNRRICRDFLCSAIYQYAIYRYIPVCDSFTLAAASNLYYTSTIHFSTVASSFQGSVTRFKACMTEIRCASLIIYI